MTNDERIREILKDLDRALLRIDKAQRLSVAPASQTLLLAERKVDDAREVVFAALCQTSKLKR